MRRWKRLNSYLPVIAAMLLGAQAASASEAYPKILVMVTPLVPYVEAITHGVADTKSILQPGQDPHHFALRPSQAQAMAQADILIIPTLRMSPVMKALAAKNKKLQVIELSELYGANPRPYDPANPWIDGIKLPEKKSKQKSLPKQPETTAKEPAEPEAPNIDPHFWLDPERMAAIALPLAEALGDINPANRALFKANAGELSRHLREEVTPALRHILKTNPAHNQKDDKPEIAYITDHAAYQYFLTAFQLPHTGEIVGRSEAYLGAETLDRVLMASKQNHIRCLMVEGKAPIVERISTLSGAKITLLSAEQPVNRESLAQLPWIKNDYDALLYKTAKTFADCL